MDTLTNVILSIKPEYAQAIMSGIKKVEFRKKIFKRSVDKVFVYSSSPQKKIIGYFTIEEVIEDNPKALWKRFQNVGAISEENFFDYYNNADIGYSIVIKEAEEFKVAVDPTDFFENFCAPQSYIYMEDNGEFLKSIDLIE